LNNNNNIDTIAKNDDFQIKSLLGIGNPLLDISVTVDRTFLEKYHKKAGDATLAAEADLPLYKEIVEFQDVLYIAGGATQNSIRGAQWIVPKKGTTHYFGGVGDDENGKILKKAAEMDGVQTHYYISKTHHTGCCAVLIVDTERSLVADLGAANDYQHSHFQSPEIQELIRKVDIFYSAGFFITVSPQTVVELGKFIAENNKIFVWCVSAPFIAEFYLDRVREILPYVDYLVANEVEAATLLKCLGIEEKDSELGMKTLSELPKTNAKRSRTVMFTQGSNPVLVYDNGKFHSFPVPPISSDLIVDTNGAGDSFLGGFLAGLMQDKSLEECIRAAMFTARHILQVSGTQYNVKCDFDWK